MTPGDGLVQVVEVGRSPFDVVLLVDPPRDGVRGCGRCDDTEVTYFLIMGRETPFRSEEEAMQSYERRGDE